MAIDNKNPDANPAAPKKVRRAQRRVMALELRKQGGSYREIAKRMREAGVVSARYNESAAYMDCMAALKDLLNEQKELAQENLRLDLERLDEMLRGVFQSAKKGDTFSVNSALGILDRRAKLLNYASLDAQTNLNIDMTQLSQEQLERLANGENPISVLASPGKG